MTYVVTQPQIVATAAADVAGIGSALNAANAAAAGSTTGLVEAAADEVSAAAATVFNTYGQTYQAVITQAGTFHAEFARALAAASSAYAHVEAEASGALGALIAPAQAAQASSTAAPAIVPPTPVGAVLVMSGSGGPTPPPSEVLTHYNNFIAPHFTTSNLLAVSTPEGLYPISGTKDLTLDISVARGVVMLDNAIQQQFSLGNKPVTVFGVSQSSIIASMEMTNLYNAHVPTSDASFVLVADPMQPNGGLLSRFPGLTMPSLGLTFYGATPANTGYSTYIYSLEYDGFCDFPQYPLNIVSDLNAVAGIAFYHGVYPNPQALPPGYTITTLPTSPATTAVPPTT